MSELTAELLYYLKNAPTSNFFGADIEVIAQWEGADNLLWRVRCGRHDAVVKYYLDAGQARGRRQYDGQERFHTLGIAPQPLWFDRYPAGLSRQVLVYRWVPGQDIAGNDVALLVNMAQAVAQIHMGDPSAVRRFSPHPVNLEYLWSVLQGGLPVLYRWLQHRSAIAMLNLLHRFVHRATEVVVSAFPLWQGVAPTPVHGDLKLENVIDSFGTAVLVDWELFGLGDAAHDIALFFSHNRHHLTTEAREAWLERYLATHEQAGIVQRIGVYERILPLHQLLYLLHGLCRNIGDEEADLLQANQPMLSRILLAAVEHCAAALDCHETIDEEAIALLF